MDNEILLSKSSSKSVDSFESSSTRLPLKIEQTVDGMYGVERFILYSAMNAFLRQEIEYCLNICQKDFQFLSNDRDDPFAAYTKVFQANMLRIKALALENSIQRQESQLSMLVRYKTQNDSSKEKNEQREKILEAIEAVKDSIDAFEDDQWRE